MQHFIDIRKIRENASLMGW